MKRSTHEFIAMNQYRFGRKINGTTIIAAGMNEVSG